MDDKARLFGLKNQHPMIQLFTAVSIVIIAGTFLFYLFVFAGSLIFRIGFSEMLKLPDSNAGLREIAILKYLQAAQQIALFIIPSILIVFLLSNGSGSFLRLNKVPGSFQVLLVIILAFLILPVTSYTGILNSKMSLSDRLSGIEEWMRTKEDTADYLTGLLIKAPEIWILILNIFVLALIPSIAEEMIFRGIFQQLLCRIIKSGHAGIWITAIFFSAIHLQFFGFLPRLILGLIFGYLFFWTGNLWIAVTAHFLNNAIPVVMSHFTGWSYLGDKANGLPGKETLLPLLPALLSCGIFYYFWSEYRKTKPAPG
jgi:uncharacterized protein